MSFKMAAPSRTQVLSLYRALLRESAGFSAYNYRTYAIRRIRDAFKENRGVSDVQEMQKLVNKAKENLEVIKRQSNRGNCTGDEHWLREDDEHPGIADKDSSGDERMVGM
ncbi:LYR motif-containing protein 4 isoform X1 [Ambystoma mexicanum]|uniref:LYR motif-containing protein 4 isoform X1 n=1 Tax=Ambystoma mexicanum TaxID=8296 RepID=UPI0037E72C8D